MDSHPPITKLLSAISAGDQAAAEQLLPHVYQELRALAAVYFRQQPDQHTLQPTALVHEAYLKLIGQTADWSSRNQFFAVAARAMRSILIDHARAKHREKRGGGKRLITLSPDPSALSGAELPVEAIDDALKRLAALDERKARLVELRFFGGLTIEDAADVLNLARSTATEDWRMARAWLYDQLKDHIS